MNARILIIDDDSAIRELLSAYLSMFGYQADCAAGGLEALELIEKRIYDLLVTDFDMPGMNGLDLVKKLRARRITVPIFAMSGEPVSTVFLEAGADLFMMKPVNLESLKKEIEALA